jgi:putative salt-induced outer membrane protein YdiY
MKLQKVIAGAILMLAFSAQAKEEEWKANGGVSGIFNSGNAESQTFGGNALISVKMDQDQIAWTGSGAYGRAKDAATGIASTNTENWQTQLRYDRFLTEKFSLYTLGHMRHDAPAGFDLNYGGSLGYAHFFYKSEMTTFKYELGFDVTQQRFTTLIEETAYSVRAFLQFTHKFSQSVFLGEDLENLFNIEDASDYRLNSMTSLNFSLTQKVAFQAGYAIRFDNQPVAGFRSLDTMTQVGLNINFL